jgi:energy-converting hydrogenase Eha subunit C
MSTVPGAVEDIVKTLDNEAAVVAAAEITGAAAEITEAVVAAEITEVVVVITAVTTVTLKSAIKEIFQLNLFHPGSIYVDIRVFYLHSSTALFILVPVISTIIFYNTATTI